MYDVQGQAISLQYNNARIEEVLMAIEFQSGYFFTYTREQLAGTRPVTIKLTNATLISALDSCFANQPLTYEIAGRSIILKRRPLPPDKAALTDSIAILLLIDVHGTVFDQSNGQPLAGATIAISNTQSGTYADNGGNFFLGNLPDSTLLEISFVGFVSQTVIATRESSFIRVGLAPDKALLASTIVNTGLYRRPSANFTGASFSARGTVLKTTNPTNVIQSLARLDPSMRLTENYLLGSDPNLLPVIQIRGQNNLPLSTQGSEENAISLPVSSGDIMAGYIANPNEPIIILDGFQTTIQTLYDMDINRIEKITVLKDAAATVAYGSRAANGVIVVETKRPNTTKTQLTYSMNMNLQWAELAAYSLMNAEELLQAQKLAGIYSDTLNNANNIALNQWYDQRLYQAKSGVNTDWLAQPVRTGTGVSHSLNLTGGNKSVSYNLNFHYNNVQGSMQGSQRKTYGVAAWLGYRSGSVRITNQMQALGISATNSGGGPFSNYARQFPYFRPYDSSGNPISILEPSASELGIPVSAPGGIFSNPLNDAWLVTRNQSNYRLFTNTTQLEWILHRNLKITGMFHLYNQLPESESFLPATHSSFTGTTAVLTDLGSYTAIEGKNQMYEGRLSLDYSEKKNDHIYYLSAGVSAQETISSGKSITVTGLPTGYLPEPGSAAGYGNNVKPFSGYSQTRSLNLYGSMSYAYKGRYMLELSGNAGGSSQFGTDNRLAPFAALGAGWNLHNEHLLTTVTWVQQLRLFATYGITGNQNFAAFMAQPIYQYNLQNNYRLQTGAMLQGFANPNLKWQQTQKTNFGLDAVLANEKINLRFDYYIERTNNLILPIGVAPSTGFVSYQDNLGEVKNTGYELRLTAQLASPEKQGWGWEITLNGGHYQNRIESLSPAIEALNNESNTAGVNQKIPQPRYEVGQSVTRIWAVQSLGIDPATGNELFRKRDGTTTFLWDPLDKIPAGEASSKFKGLLSTQFTWQGLNAGILFGYEWGGQVYNQTLTDKIENVNLAESNGDKRVLTGRWQKPGDQVYFKSLQLFNVPTNATTRFVQNNNYIEAASLTAGYAFPQKLKWVRFLKLQGPRIYIVHNNAFRISSVTMERGTQYPFSRSFNLGFTTSF